MTKKAGMEINSQYMAVGQKIQSYKSEWQFRSQHEQINAVFAHTSAWKLQSQLLPFTALSFVTAG